LSYLLPLHFLAEALDVERTVPEGEKSDKIAIKKEALAAIEKRKVDACGE
jgi:hypothetical protein